MSVMALRSSTGWRSTMSISLSPSRYWPIVLPDRIVREACAMAWLVTPSARALSWSISRRSTLIDSFQLSLTPRMFGLARSTSLAWSAHWRTAAASSPTTRNCTGYGTGGPLGSSLTRPRTSGNSSASSSGRRRRSASRSFRSFGQHDRLADVGLREDLVERQVEARHARCRSRCVTLSTPGSCIMRASKRRAISSLCWIVEPSGSHRSTRISGRLESGKNCCCTWPMPTMPSAKLSSVRPMVIQRCCTHQSTARRKRV